ncbi:MAG: AAA domain-containing protein, partial [Candidatus Omnitrophota bacterium]
IKRLEVRFSELKILEREQCPTYHKYHKIRYYDIIDPSDSIPPMIDSGVATALAEYSTLLRKLTNYYLDIENIFFLSGDNPTLLKIKADHFSVFLKYCDIRDYDIIDPSDSIPDGMDSQVGHALFEYSTLLQRLKDSYSDIEKILPHYDLTLTDEDYLNSIEVAIEHIKQLIHAFEWIKKNLFTNKDILDFCQQFSQLNKPLDSTEGINYLDALIQWVDKYCNELITSKKLLSELYNLEIDFQIIKKQTVEYGLETENILKCIENLTQRLQGIRGFQPEDSYSEYPDNLFLEETKLHLETLSASSNSWLRWHLYPSARNSRRFLASTKFPRVMYKRRIEFLDKVKAWHNHWTLRNQIVKDFKYLSELNIPIKSLSLKPTLAELHENANLAHKYLQVMVAVDSFPAIYSDKIKNFLEQKVLNISTFEGISVFKECLEKTKKYSEISKSLNELKSNNSFVSSLFSSFEKTICELCPDEEGDKVFNRLIELYPYFYDYKELKSLEYTVLKNLPQTCDKLRDDILKQNTIKAVEPELVIEAFKLAKYVRENLSVNPSALDEGKIRKLQPYFDDYIRIKALEGSDLKTLPKTCSKIKSEILKGNSIPALKSPDLIVEAFRLSAFMRDDLLKNPDDINEVGAKIKRLKEESREKIKKILNTNRKLALKEAECSNTTREMINKLRHLLRKKRKTYSFVQLRDQIDYKRLLSVFPCWIMSIEDVSRIFPLEEGLFDYLIVDEASQCNQATALHLAYRAKRMVVVGDDKQMKNPNTQFLSDSVVRLNLTKHNLDNHPRVVFFYGRNSLLDLAAGCQDISPAFLNEHFRCEPPIIDFSNKYFYDKNLKILTQFRRRRFNPCMELRVINGAYDDPDDTKQNIVEAKAVIAELKRMIESGGLEGDRKGEKLSVGILSLFRRQATLLQSMMYEAFESAPHIIKEHDIIVSTVDGFQGDERDVILYSFRYASNSKPGSVHVLQREDEHSLGRLNVAFSRARRRVICFISVPKDNFPKGLIRDYLTHVTSVQNSSYSRLGNPNEREKCQSDFERDVFDELVKIGLEVYAQVPCAGFFIDFVVIDKEGRRIAIECDGEFHYDEYGELREEDHQRQDIIERNGWFVYRISSRKFYTNPQKVIDKLIEDLQKQLPDEEISVAEVSPISVAEVSPESFAAQTILQEIIAEIEPSSEPTSPIASVSIEDRIIEILSEEGPIPLWKIAQKMGQPKEDIIPKLEKLLEKEYVINYIENGVKLWKAID